MKEKQRFKVNKLFVYTTSNFFPLIWLFYTKIKLFENI